MTTALAPIQSGAPVALSADGPRALALTDVQAMLGFARLAVTAGIVGRGQSQEEAAAQACMAIASGAELGLGPMASLRHCIIIKGRPAMSAQLIAQRIRQSGRYDYRVTVHTDDACVIALDDRGANIGTVRWDLARAKQAGLGGENWSRYPRAMLFARAISEAARTYCPEVLGAISISTEEARDEGDHPRPESAPFEGAHAPAADGPDVSELVGKLRALAADTRLPAIARDGIGRLLARDNIPPEKLAKALKRALAMLPSAPAEGETELILDPPREGQA